MFAKAFVIGAGNIGSSYDLHRPRDCLYPKLTHLGNLLEILPHHEVFCYDLNISLGFSTAHHWGCTFIDRVPEIFPESSLVVISTPTDTHESIVESTLNGSPSFLVVEKPFGLSAKKYLEITDILNEKEIPYLVNYSRRWDFYSQFIFDSVCSGRFGEVERIEVEYNKSAYNTLSHAFDFFLEHFSWFDICGVKWLKVLSRDDFYGSFTVRADDVCDIDFKFRDLGDSGRLILNFYTEKGILTNSIDWLSWSLDGNHIESIDGLTNISYAMQKMYDFIFKMKRESHAIHLKKFSDRDLKVHKILESIKLL